ncbi:MAG: hypothetical protein GEU73_17660 [Chloroflexi bacterium]|nr:hypothetical protein [Chloroflexota bacterium]
MRGTDEIDVEVRGPAEPVTAALKAIPRVVSVSGRANGPETHVFSVECEVGSDVRELIATSIVQQGWGLRDLRPASVSLEEVFVHLVTSEPGVS